MIAAYIYMLITFGTGILLLLGWLYFTAEKPRSTRILLKSVGLFVLPGIALALVPPRLIAFPFAAFVGTFVEECLKATAAAAERNEADRFWLVALFGIWELMLVKPLWGFGHAGLIQDWTQLELAGLTTAGLITVLMHSITAEIYAFRFGGSIPAAFLASWALHCGFNLSVDWLGVSLIACVILLLPLFLLFAALWPSGLRSRFTHKDL
jgi:hypothetical protein